MLKPHLPATSIKFLLTKVLSRDAIKREMSLLRQLVGTSEHDTREPESSGARVESNDDDEAKSY
jgi:hypothetical protein